MGGTTSKYDALKLLELYDGDIDKAIAALRQAAIKEPQRPAYDVPVDAPVVVKMENVSKKYKLGSERVSALKNISISIRQGEFVAITGTSGSGKSTMLQLIGGLDKPSEGTVLIDGQNVRKMNDRKLSVLRNQTIGFVFQFFYLQPFLNTQANLEVPGMFARTPRRLRIKKARELSSAVGLSDRLLHLPKELSGGQMQRAAIARALFNEPKILLADEPTGNLDQENSKAIIELFKTVREKFGTTIVIVTHDQTIAAQADREIKLEDGILLT